MGWLDKPLITTIRVWGYTPRKTLDI